jgi:hypothetical protein
MIDSTYPLSETPYPRGHSERDRQSYQAYEQIGEHRVG